MRRLGKFTGILYSKDYDFSKCPECCVCIDDEQANDNEFINERHLKDLRDCIACLGCPASKNH